MKKRFLSLILTLVVLMTGMSSVFAAVESGMTTNPTGSVPNAEDINGFKNGVLTQYYDVSGFTSIGNDLQWNSLDLDFAITTGNAIETNGFHTTKIGTPYLTHKSYKNSFFYNIDYDRDLTKDAIRHEGYIYLLAGTTPMKIISDDGFILRMDLVNPNNNGIPVYTLVRNEWRPQGESTFYLLNVTVQENGYYRYQMDYFNWGGDGVLRWLTAPKTVQPPTSPEGLTFSDIANGMHNPLYLYEIPFYKLTLQTVGQGTLVPSVTATEKGYQTGTVVGLTATPATGWSFQGITDIASGGSITMNSDKTVVATFVENPPAPPSPPPAPVNLNYPLTVTVEGPGTAAPAGTGNYSENSFVVLTATPDTNATFVGWFGENGTEITADNRIYMNGVKSVIARFQAPQPVAVVTESAVPAAAPSVEPSAPAASESAQTPAEETITNETVAQAAPELPKTGGIPMLMLIGLGVAAVAGGAKLRK